MVPPSTWTGTVKLVGWGPSASVVPEVMVPLSLLNVSEHRGHRRPVLVSVKVTAGRRLGVARALSDQVDRARQSSTSAEVLALGRGRLEDDGAPSTEPGR